MGVAAEKADVLIVDVHVDELAKITAVVLDVLGERGKLCVELGEQSGKVLRFAGKGLLAVCEAGEWCGQRDFYAHRAPPARTSSSSTALRFASELSTSRM